jgi:hypothetical protein
MIDDAEFGGDCWFRVCMKKVWCQKKLIHQSVFWVFSFLCLVDLHLLLKVCHALLTFLAPWVSKAKFIFCFLHCVSIHQDHQKFTHKWFCFFYPNCPPDP